MKGQMDIEECIALAEQEVCNCGHKRTDHRSGHRCQVPGCRCTYCYTTPRANHG